MNNDLLNRLRNSLHETQASGLYRKRFIDSGDSDYLNFSSNDYLSLSSDPRIKKAYQSGYACYPTGSGGSPLVSGYHPVHRELELAFADALGVDDCLFFVSGYAANLGIAALFARLDALAILDKASHASIYDGIAMAGVRYKRYRHCDLDDLQSKLVSSDSAVVFTESVFSMSGQIAPLAELAKLSSQYGFELCVDEAHAFGVMGDEGLGLVKALNLMPPLRVIPLGKAFAGSGAIVAGQKDWIDALVQSARSYIYSTAPSPAVAYGLLGTLDVVRSLDERRSKLTQLIAYFREAVKNSEMTWRDSTTAIQQLQIGCPHRAQLLAESLLKQSIMCLPMRQPTVKKHETGLRVILNYHHQPEDIDRLLKCIHSC